MVETVIKHPQRAEAERAWNLPYAAVEEVLVNAMYHRSYEEREPIEVRIEMTLPGVPRSRNQRYRLTAAGKQAIRPKRAGHQQLHRR